MDLRVEKDLDIDAIVFTPRGRLPKKTHAKLGAVVYVARDKDKDVEIKKAFNALFKLLYER